MAADPQRRTTADGRPADPMNASLSGLIAALRKDKAFASVANSDASLIVGAPSGIRPALAAAIAENATTSQVVYIVSSSREAEETVNALRSWYSGSPSDIAQLEAWETLPHERLSPRADTVASRMAVFRRLRHPDPANPMFGPIRILVMPVRSLIQPVVAGLGDVEPLVFVKGEELPLDEAVERLVRNAYTRVELVMNRGEFAVRGGILDVFPPTYPHPVATRSTRSGNSTPPTSVRTAMASAPSGPRPAASCNSPTRCAPARKA